LIFQIIIVQIITFVTLVLILRKILISSSYNETSRLQKLNEENAKKSKDLARKIAAAENEYTVKMEQAEDEIRELKNKARKEVEEIKAAIIAKGKTESEQIIAHALNSKKEIRAEIEEEMKDKSIAFSCKIFQKVLSSDEQKLVFDGLLESVFKEMEKIDKDRLMAIDFGEASEGVAEVKSSHPMSAQQKQKLEEILSSKLDQKIDIKEIVEREVIAGIVICLGSFVIDGSLLERFRKAVEEMK